MGSGYLRVEICKLDGSGDSQKAREVFDYCSKNFSWFSCQNYFMVDNSSIINNEELWCDGGIDISDVPDDFDWLCEAQKEVGAERVVVRLIKDYSDISLDENYSYEAILEGGKILDDSHVQYHDFMNGEVGEVDSCFYSLMNESFNLVCAKFRNKKTGQEVLGGRISVYPSDEFSDEYEDVDYIYVFVNMDEAILLDSNNNPTDTKGFDHFSDDYDILSDFEFPSDVSEWEFVGFDAEPGFFELYAQNPSAKEFEWVE